MKIRNSFVSNSSSSSFVLIVGEDTYQKVFNTLGPLEKDMAAWLAKDGNIEGKKVRVFNGRSGENGWTFGYYKPGAGKTRYKKGTDEEGEESLDEVWEGVEKKLTSAGPHYYHADYY